MDIGNVSPPVGGGYVSQSQGAYQAVSSSAQTTTVQAQITAAAQAAATQQQQQAPSTAQQARYEEVKQASQAVQSNYFVVSDVSFTIFKDLDGDYVTRYTSLKDGSVKYYPQKALFEQVQILHSRERADAVFRTEV